MQYFGSVTIKTDFEVSKKTNNLEVFNKVSHIFLLHSFSEQLSGVCIAVVRKPAPEAEDAPWQVLLLLPNWPPASLPEDQEDIISAAGDVEFV